MEDYDELGDLIILHREKMYLSSSLNITRVMFIRHQNRLKEGGTTWFISVFPFQYIFKCFLLHTLMNTTQASTVLQPTSFSEQESAY